MVPRILVPQPSITELIKNREFWRNKILHNRGMKIVYDQDIRTGVCYFCKKMGDAQKSRITYLHHVKYDNDDLLRWTIEVCSKCHSRIDPNNRKIIVRNYAKKPRVIPKPPPGYVESGNYYGSYYDRK